MLDTAVSEINVLDLVELFPTKPRSCILERVSMTQTAHATSNNWLNDVDIFLSIYATTHLQKHQPVLGILAYICLSAYNPIS